MTWRFDQFLYQKEKSLGLRALLLPLSLCSLPYGWAVRLRSLLYEVGLLTAKRLPCPVISVGNLTVGGTGKTPLVMFLARKLLETRIPIAILSRGYRRQKTPGAVVTDGKALFLSPEEAGDEAYLMAHILEHVPVLVGKDRFVNGRKALQQFGIQGLLLDDGYQHLQLRRDLNILLVDSEIGFGDRALFPRGILREPLTQLRRADLILLTKTKRPETYQGLESEIRRIHPTLPIFHSHYEAQGLVGPRDEWDDLTSLQGKSVLALSGVATPRSFTSLLRQCGAEIASEAIYPDHHRYTARDIASLEEKATRVDRVVTTEKDLVRLKGLSIDHLSIRGLRIEVKISEEEEFLKRVFGLFPHP